MVQNSMKLGHEIIHLLKSLGVSELANKWVQQIMQVKQANERMVQTNERKGKQMNQCLNPYFWIFQTTVQ